MVAAVATIIVGLSALLPAVALAGKAAPGVKGAPATRAAWTFMVYLDGDNNLDPWGAVTLDLMAQGLAASGRGNVVVPVLYDHRGPGGAEKGVVTASGYRKVADVPEPDMSSGDTLAAFVAETVRAYPAQRYVLDVWDHGSGWVYLCSDETTEDASDHWTDGVMTVDELGAGIAAGEKAAGRSIDLVVFEACNMGMMEVSYELRGLTDVVVGTEITQAYEGVPWNTTLRDLDRTPSMSTFTLGSLMCDDLVRSYLTEVNSVKCIATLSAIDCSRQVALAAALDNLAAALMADMKHWQGAVGSAGAVAKDQLWCTSVNGINWFADAGKFAEEVAKQIDDPQVDYWAARVQAEIAAGIYAPHSKNLDGKLTGISISFPPNQSMYDMKNWIGWDYAGIGLDFTADTRWDEMLGAYYTASGQL